MAYNQEAINLIWNELSSRGVKPAVAAGAIAGIMGESGAGLDPLSFNAKDPGGGSGGILQWRADRLIGDHGLLAFARANGVDVDPNTPTDSKKVPLAIQVKFMGHELDGRYNGVLKGLQSVNSGEEGLDTWVDNMEVPADKVGAKAQRQQYIAPVSKLLGAPAPAGSAGAGSSATSATPGGYVPPTPGQMTGSMIGQALAGMGTNMSTPSGGGSYMDTSGDQPAIRSMAAQTDFMQTPNALPAQYSGGAGGGLSSQLGALAAAPPMSALENPATAPSITAGAPGMTSLLGPLGTNATPGLFDQRGGSQLTPNPYRSTMRLS